MHILNHYIVYLKGTLCYMSFIAQKSWEKYTKYAQLDSFIICSVRT